MRYNNGGISPNLLLLSLFLFPQDDRKILLSNDLFYFPVLIFHYRSKLGSCYRRLNRTHLLMVFSPWAAVTRE